MRPRGLSAGGGGFLRRRADRSALGGAGLAEVRLVASALGFGGGRPGVLGGAGFMAVPAWPAAALVRTLTPHRFYRD